MNDDEDAEHSSGSFTTTTSEHHSNGAFTAIERAKLVVTTIIGVCVLMGTVCEVWAFLNTAAQAQERADVKRLDAVDATMSAQLRMVVEVMTLQATMQIEPQGSPDYNDAVARLRALRRIGN